MIGRLNFLSPVRTPEPDALKVHVELITSTDSDSDLPGIVRQLSIVVTEDQFVAVPRLPVVDNLSHLAADLFVRPLVGDCVSSEPQGLEEIPAHLDELRNRFNQLRERLDQFDLLRRLLVLRN